ncbi:Uncharacterised protein [Bordetella pertussis]|nr:Uncharacterised protein [Bordetella pertussis]
MPLGDQRQGLLGQQRIAQQQPVHIEHGAQLARRVLGQGVGHLQQIGLRLGQRLGQPLAFGRGILGRDAVVGDFERRRTHDHGAADRVAARHAFAVQADDRTGGDIRRKGWDGRARRRCSPRRRRAAGT